MAQKFFEEDRENLFNGTVASIMESMFTPLSLRLSSTVSLHVSHTLGLCGKSRLFELLL